MGAIWTLVDLCIAAAICVTFLVALLLLTLCGGIMLKFMGGKGGKDDRRRDADAGDESAEAASDESAPGDLFLFLIKGFLLWLLLIQGSTQLGGPVAAWACVRILERAAHQRDRSLQLLLEPPPGPLDAVFLVGVAPLLAFSVGGMHDDFATVGVHAYLCAAFFWRSRASAAVALALSLGSLLLASYLGAFRWRHYVSALGLTPAPMEPTDGAILLLATGGLLLVPRGSRLIAVATACAFSITFRRLVFVASTASAEAVLASVAMLPHPTALLPSFVRSSGAGGSSGGGAGAGGSNEPLLVADACTS